MILVLLCMNVLNQGPVRGQKAVPHTPHISFVGKSHAYPFRRTSSPKRYNDTSSVTRSFLGAIASK